MVSGIQLEISKNIHSVQLVTHKHQAKIQDHHGTFCQALQIERKGEEYSWNFLRDFSEASDPKRRNESIICQESYQLQVSASKKHPPCLSRRSEVRSQSEALCLYLTTILTLQIRPL